MIQYGLPTIDEKWTAVQLERNLSRVLNTGVCNKVLDALKSPNADFQVIAEMLKGDPYVATRVVGIANLVRRRDGVAIQSIQRAVQVLGMRQVSNLMLSVMLTGPLLSAEGQLPRRKDLWRWVIACGVANNYIAGQLGQQTDANPDHLVGGLVLGLGAIVLWAGLGQAYHRVLGARLRPMSLNRREMMDLNVIHTQVSLWTLNAMGCPDVMSEGLQALLSGKRDETYLRYRSVEVLGARIAGLDATDASAWLADGLPRLGIDPRRVENDLGELRSELRQIGKIFEVDLGSWESQQAFHQKIMVESGQALAALIVDHLTMQESLGIRES
jgi:HD-like signal output (HDOD) protein